MNSIIKNQQDKNSFLIPLIATVALVLGLGLGIIFTRASVSPFSGVGANVQSEGDYFDTDYLDQVYGILQERYIGELPPKEDITYEMVKGLINSLDDKYTSYLTPDEAKEYLNSRDPSFEGIGITLSYVEENTGVESVLPGYPAEKAGFLAGDVILEVDGEDVEKESPTYIASKIRGEAGTEVKIKIYRSASEEIKEFAAIREKIEVTNINYEAKGNGIYSIEISQFLDVTPDAFNEAWDNIVNEIVAKGDSKGIIIDLRGNPGGYVSSVKHTLEEFLKDDQIMMMEETKGEEKIVYKDKRAGKFEDIPVVVLVNEGSASASEIFASAIQENERGEVVGKPTVGKGVEQEIIDNDTDGSILIIVFQRWLTPKGNQISEESPVKPDFEAEFSLDEFRKGIDRQFEKALELLK